MEHERHVPQQFIPLAPYIVSTKPILLRLLVKRKTNQGTNAMQMTQTKIPFEPKKQRVTAPASASQTLFCSNPTRKTSSRFPSVDEILADIDQVCVNRTHAAA